MKTQQSTLNWRSLVTNRRYLLISMIGWVVSSAIIFSGLIPQINKNLELNEEIQQQQKKLDILASKLVSLREINTEQVYQNRDAVNQLLPSRKPLLELLSGLSQVATQNGIRFIDFKLTPGEIASESTQFLNEVKSKKKRQIAVQDSIFDTLDVQLEIEGTFRDVQQFFLAVEQMAPATTIASLALNIKGQEMIEADQLVQAQLVLKSHYFTQTIAAAIDSPLPTIGALEQQTLNQVSGYFFPVVDIQQQIISGGVEDLFGITPADLEKSGFEITN